MKANRLFRTLTIILILGSTIGCDQISKSMARSRIGYNEQISVLDHYLTLTKVENSGAFLSLGNTLPDPLKLILLTILPLLAIGLGFIFLLTKKELRNLTQLGICFVIGGGAGNLYDRIVHGSVTDFMHIDFILFQTGIFNMADVSIMTGMFIILLETYFRRTKPENEIPENGQETQM